MSRALCISKGLDHHLYINGIGWTKLLRDPNGVMKGSLQRTPWNFGYFMRFLAPATNYTIRKTYWLVYAGHNILTPKRNSALFNFLLYFTQYGHFLTNNLTTTAIVTLLSAIVYEVWIFRSVKSWSFRQKVAILRRVKKEIEQDKISLGYKNMAVSENLSVATYLWWLPLWRREIWRRLKRGYSGLMWINSLFSFWIW